MENQQEKKEKKKRKDKKKEDDLEEAELEEMQKKYKNELSKIMSRKKDKHQLGWQFLTD